MSTIYDYLQKQLKSEEHRKDAEDCLKIYEKLKEMNNGCVWSSSWEPLTIVEFVGIYPNSKRIYKPSKEGYVFLKGINEEKQEPKKNTIEIPVQRAIVSHLSDVQEFFTIRIGSEGKEYVIKRINFVKRLLIEYPDTSVVVGEDELNRLWQDTIKIS